jgi:transcriptional regulator with XRE-family HTH domain
MSMLTLVNKDSSKWLFGDYLKHTRESLNISIQELSRRSGVTAGYINRLERGEKTTSGNEPITPSPQVLKKLAPHLEVDYHDLLRAAGHLDDVIHKPDLYQLLLGGKVKIHGVDIEDLNFAQKIIDIIEATLNLSEEWVEIKNKK